MSKLFKNISNEKNDDNSETCYYQKRISKENFRLTKVLVWKFYGSPYGRLIIVNISKSLQTSDCSHEIKSRLLLGRKAMTNLDSMLKKQRHHYADNSPCCQSYGFSSSHLRMWELDHKDGWVLKNWCFQTVVLKKTLESPLDCKEIKPVNSNGNQPWIFIERTDAEAPIFWPPNAKSWLIGKYPEAWIDWGQEERWATEYEMVGWQLSETQWTWV